jgi:hypothetical protein
MHLAHRFISSLILASALTAPVAIIASPAPQEVQVRVYDTHHKDYHNWDAHENQTWLRWEDEKHYSHHEYAKAEKKRQEEYWNWRHSHPD